ncbi:MAG: hydantoinase/oxoprolinase family protein [Telmatospirillum sp.]|nr:hydantoinase/oxoprolinase family protein [Telmatospirillum sp.]
MQIESTATFRLGIDIGGTFTDIVATDANGRVLTKKVSSTPRDYGLGISVGVGELMRDYGIRPEQIVEVVHATTVATNAVLEGKGAATALITTEGFRDVLEFRRVRVPELYNLDYVKPKPLVPRRLRFEVRERMGPLGEVRIPLADASAVQAAQRIAEEGAKAVAICLLHSYANGDHERRVRDIAKEILGPDIFVTCSHEILPEIREYERTSTTVVNAFLGPVMDSYLRGLRDRLLALEIRCPLHVLTSGGGQMSVASAMRKPAYLVESGPAAGVIAVARIAKQANLPNVITLDMGGTTAKTAIVENGEPIKTAEYEVGAGINLSSKLVKGAGYAIKLPFIDVSEIGAGGGSLIHFDKGGLLKVGPESAGSEPGPVCYARGGIQATLTDALLVLGYINPQALVGGNLALDAERALRVFEHDVAERLGRTAAEAAHGILSISVANMVRSVKSVSTYRGRDPRGYTLVAFGGNGPIVAAAIARDIGIRRVLVPPSPGVLSAFGLLVAENEYEFVRSYPSELDVLDASTLKAKMDALEQEARAALAADGFESETVGVQFFADLRYTGQAFELTVPVPDGAVPDLARLGTAFHAEHLRTFAHHAPGEAVEMVSLRIVARVPRPVLRHFAHAANSEKPLAHTRDVYFGPAFGICPTPVLRRAELGPAPRSGPMIVEEYDSTCVVPPDSKAHVDGGGNLVLEVGA